MNNNCLDLFFKFCSSSSSFAVLSRDVTAVAVYVAAATSAVANANHDHRKNLEIITL